MINETILLSVAIPTYNGEKTIEACISSFINQTTPETEIIVSDNCSSDGTESVISTLQKKYPNKIRYHRNAENIGMDRNFDNAVRISKGAYVWILSDDDIVVDSEAIKKILKVIGGRTELGSIFANYENKVVPIAHDYHELNGDEYFEVTKFKNTLISSTIVNKKIWTSLDLTKYYGTYWTHIGYLIYANSKYKSAIVCSELVNQMVNLATERRWGQNGTFFYVGLDLASVYAEMSKLGYSSKTISAAHWYTFDKLFWNIVLGKAFGLRLKMRDIKRCIDLYGKYPSYWFVHFPVSFIPRILFKTLLATVRYLKNFKRR